MGSKPLSIAVFSDSALPILNGVSVSIDLLVRGLRERGHSVHLFTSNYAGHQETDPNTHRFFALKTPLAKDYPFTLGPFYPILAEFRKHQFDLVHTHTPFTVGFVGLRWAESHEIPIVSTYHTHYDKYTHYIPILPKRFSRYKIAKHTNWYYNNVDHVITPSVHSEKWLRRHSVSKPISVIPTAIPEAKRLDRDMIRRELGVRKHQKVLLYVGRIAREKNLEQLLRSASIAFDKDPNLVLWLVGDGPAREDYRRLTSDLGIGDRIKFFGFIPRKDVDKFYAAADVFTFPSMTETQGLVVVEAMSYGLPAVVMKGGGASDPVVNGVNGVVVGNDSESFAQACLKVLGETESERTYFEGALDTAEQYSLTKMIDKIESCYQRVLDPESVQEKMSVF